MDDPFSYTFSEASIGFLVNLQSVDSSILIWIFTLIALLFVSGLISASEVAFFSLGRDIEDLPESKIKDKILELLESPKSLLATILIVNNFINVAIVLVSTYISTSIIDVNNSSPIVLFILQAVLITFIILLFGEILPKVVANVRKKTVTTLMAYPIVVLQFLFYPLVIFLVKSTSLIDNKLRAKNIKTTVDDLSKALEITNLSNDKDDEHKILKGIVEFGKIDVSQIMTPRIDVAAIDCEYNLSEVVDVILKSGYSRLPVFKETLDQVEGILFIKDLLKYIDEKEDYPWQKLMRQPLFVPENKKIDDLLYEFQTRKVHMAIVVDEYGGASGLVTLEDILEEIVGEINDEFDEDNKDFVKIDDNNYVFEAKTAISQFIKLMEEDEELFNEVKGDADTLGGLILELTGKIPIKNETTFFGNYQFTIDAADNRRIKKIRVTKLQETKNEN